MVKKNFERLCVASLLISLATACADDSANDSALDAALGPDAGDEGVATEPQSTGPQSTAPQSTGPQSTGPQSTGPQPTGPQATTEPGTAEVPSDTESSPPTPSDEPADTSSHVDDDSGAGVGTDTGPATGPGLHADGGTALLDWVKSDEVVEGVAIEYAFLNVPVDHQQPAGEQLLLALARRRSTAAEHSGVLLFNPGGPGVGVVEDAAGLTEFLSTLFPTMDIVLVDNRGTGLSAPLACSTLEETYGPAPLIGEYAPATDAGSSDTSVPSSVSDAGSAETSDVGSAQSDAGASTSGDAGMSPAEQAAWDSLIYNAKLTYWLRSYCLSTFPTQLPYFNSENVARDMDSVREALGEEQLNFWGVSYGSVQGALYAKLYPTRVRAFALDSVVLRTADADPMQDIVATVQAYEEQLGRFFEWASSAAASPLYGHAAGSAQEIYDNLVLELEQDVVSEGEFVDPGLIGSISVEYLRRGDWDSLALALKDAADGDWETAIALSLGNGISNEDEHSWIQFQAFKAITMLDQRCPADGDDEAAFTLYESLSTEYPRLGPGFASALGDCFGWDVPPAESQILPNDVESAPMLVLNGLHDPATPYSNAVGLVAQLNNGSRLLTSEQEGHGVGGSGPCADAALTNFIVSADVTAAPEQCATPAQGMAMRRLRELVLRKTSLSRRL